jgi:hypothetical protein
MIMVVYRYFLVQIAQGPEFDAVGVIIMEPLFLLFGLMLTTIYLEKMEVGGLFDRLRNSLDDPVPHRRTLKVVAMSTVGSGKLAS